MVIAASASCTLKKRNRTIRIAKVWRVGKNGTPSAPEYARKSRACCPGLCHCTMDVAAGIGLTGGVAVFVKNSVPRVSVANDRVPVPPNVTGVAEA